MFGCCDCLKKKATNQVAHVNCGNCRTTLVFPYGAPSVKCAICHYVTNVGVSIIPFFRGSWSFLIFFVSLFVEFDMLEESISFINILYFDFG